MLKKALITLTLTLLAVSGFSQGQVNFATLNLGTTAQVYNEFGALATGTAYLAQLYAANGTGQAEGSLVPVGNAVNFRVGLNAGYVQTTGTSSLGVPVNSTVDATLVNGGAVTLQLRAWSSTYTTYAAALAAGAATGKSTLLSLATTGNPQAAPPGTPVDLIGLTGFSMTAPVPEPATYALLGLGALGFALRRRK